jgi:hypothetical protein
MTLFRSRRVRTGAATLGLLVALLLLVVALFPYGLFKAAVERRLSARFGQPVTIASLERVDRFGLAPVLRVRGLTIPQPAWAGHGDFVRLAQGQARLALWPLLVGRVSPSDIHLSGLRLALVRAADGSTNWQRQGRGGKGGGFDAGAVAGLRITDSKVVYRDAKRDRQVVATLSVDPARGLRIDGRGSVMGTPVTLTVRGGPTIDGGKPWPFVARLDGPALTMAARGTADRPLDMAAMRVAVTARAFDLRLIDAVIEAGLFGTRPVMLAAEVRRDRGDWTIGGLHGTIGGSDIAGDLTVTERDGRHLLAGHVVSHALAFDDLSSDEGRARAAALERRIGPKLVPDLRVDLADMATTDGRLDVRVDRIVSHAGPSSLRALRGTLNLDHQRLVVDPFVLDLTTGVIRGRATVAQEGRPVPTVTLDLRLTDGSITALAGGGGSVTGTVAARARLTGRGATLREAVGTSDGRIGFVARDGVLPARVAAALGFDAGRAFFADPEGEAGLRCVIVPLMVRHGRGTLDPAMVVDTSQSQLHGQGTIDFPSEAMAIRLTGAPKHGSILRLPGSASIGGTIREPQVVVPPEVKSVGNILKAIGRAITGDQPPVAVDADCAALSAAALR